MRFLINTAVVFLMLIFLLVDVYLSSKFLIFLFSSKKFYLFAIALIFQVSAHIALLIEIEHFFKDDIKE